MVQSNQTVLTPLESEEIRLRKDVNFIFEIEKMRTQSQFKNGGPLLKLPTLPLSAPIVEYRENYETIGHLEASSRKTKGLLFSRVTLYEREQIYLRFDV